MRKEFFKRAVIGALAGVVISTVISIVISYCKNDGSYYPVVPQLAELCGGVVNAVTVQTIGVLIYGAIMAGISVIWDMDGWSLTKQTAAHFALCSSATLPAAYLLQWIDHSVAGVLGYFGMFAAVYVIIWVFSWLGMRRKVKLINNEMRNLTTE